MIYTLEHKVKALESYRQRFFGEHDEFDDEVSHEHDLDIYRKPTNLVLPLVLRARKGELVKIHFKNKLRRTASIHIQGVKYKVQTSDGASVGNNESSIVLPGDDIEYEWDANREGEFLFHDMADINGDENGTNARGLFGSLVVEPENATWYDSQSGIRLDNKKDKDEEFFIGDGLYVSVDPKGRNLNNSEFKELDKNVQTGEENSFFREYVIFFHDEAPVTHLQFHDDMESHVISGDEDDGEGAHKDEGHETMFISYRTEPMTGRLRILKKLKEQGKLDEDVDGEEQHHSSWLFGDPSTPVLHAYRNDPTKIRLVHAGVKETHVFHLHLHQWYLIPNNKKSPIIDSITISPQTSFTLEILYGAGSKQGAIGDIIWHCHLYPHFHGGMWGMLRVHDVLEDGRIGRNYPDETKINPLWPLPDRNPPNPPTKNKPGFPLFMPGAPVYNPGEESKEQQPDVPKTFRYPIKSPPPPCHEHRNDRGLKEFTELEDKNKATPNPQCGEWFVQIGKKDEANRCPDLKFEIVVMKADIIYNNSGWIDPTGHLYVLKEDYYKVCNREKKPEPLFIRANKGQTVELTLTNKLPFAIRGNVFDPLQRSVECALHVHLVKFDPLVADGSSVGWNYISGVLPGETMTYRWEVDEEFGTVFFHDHLLANYRQKRGLFGALLAEPEGSTHHYQHDLDPEKPPSIGSVIGNAAVIRRKDGTYFREFCIAQQDFAPLFTADGEPLNPPNHPGDLGDNGVMGFNYRCEPLSLRDRDPAHWFSSKQGLTNRDPATPIFHTYPGDKIQIRLIQGSHEEQHSFMIHGMRWRQWWKDENSVWRNQQTIGISEAFTLNMDHQYWPGDHMYLSAPSDDLWLGCWGIIRSHDKKQQNIDVLQDNQAPAFNGPKIKPFDEKTARRFEVVARRHKIIYNKSIGITDPYGLVFEVVKVNGESITQSDNPEPLILRCKKGEWVEVTLRNEFPEKLEPEPDPPMLPLDDKRRRVSNRVSLHANLLVYDVREYDGTAVGFNKDQTIVPREKIVYRWYADEEGVKFLQDMADFRNHRHHGLIGAIVVEPEDVLSVNPANQNEKWVGSKSVIRHVHSENSDGSILEMVLILQDGLRLFLFNSNTFPWPDTEQVMNREPDPEDEGHKGFNYLVSPIRIRLKDENGRQITYVFPMKNPETSLWEVNKGDQLWLRLVIASDKPRNHSFTIHDHSWNVEANAEIKCANDTVKKIQTSSIGGLTTGVVHDICLIADDEEGDYAYRSGVLRWSLEHGLWGIIRIS